MNINLTILGQAIAFAIFVWFCLKFVWPPIISAMEARKQGVSDALAAAERARQAKTDAEREAKALLAEARERADTIVQQAERRAGDMISDAQISAKQEGERIVAAAHAEVDRQVDQARETLRKQVAILVVQGAEQVLQRDVDVKTHAAMLDSLAAKL